MASFELKIAQLGKECQFSLSWGEGQCLSASLAYPQRLESLYNEWQTAYHNHYLKPRGKVKSQGTLSKPMVRNHNWRADLVRAESELLDEFHRWLWSAELVEIRKTIVKEIHREPVYLFITCTPFELGKLPWETWDLGSDLGAERKVAILRQPEKISHTAVRPIRRKARILAILGDATGLNLEEDEAAMNSLAPAVEVEFFGGENKGETAETLIEEVCKKIADPRGWDLLFFAGHSREGKLTGGEIEIAPGVSLFLKDLKPCLHIAKQRGLQFAIFNSCSGMNIAESLIDLGLNQVIVMREPVPNLIAQEFILEFVASLATYKDVYQAFEEAREKLQQGENKLLYPSADLIPSLYSHPEAELFRLQPFGVRAKLKRWQPTWKEGLCLGGLLLASLFAPVQDLLLDPRFLVQAAYSRATAQVPAVVESPILLVSIDDQSLIADEVKRAYPLDYSYLARLVDGVNRRGAKLVGIDYVLDREEAQEEATQMLSKSLQEAVKENQTWFAFGSLSSEDQNTGRVSAEIASANWSMSGDIFSYDFHLELLPANGECGVKCPLAYLLALAHSLQQEASVTGDLPQPQLESEEDFLTAVVDASEKGEERTALLAGLRLFPLANFAQWFHPLIDFSLPPDLIAREISACQLLGSCEGSEEIPEDLANKIVLIAPGGYEEAGLYGEGQDNYSLPLAVSFWRGESEKVFTGSQTHAYTLYQLLNQHFVFAIPDALAILLAALLGKGVSLVVGDNPGLRKKYLIGSLSGTLFYLGVSLQVFVTLKILIPVVLPGAIFWLYLSSPPLSPPHWGK